MSAILYSGLVSRVREINRPHHHVRCASTNLVITPRTTVGLDRVSPSYPAHLVFIAVWAYFHPMMNRR